jgi:hypothetical protein
MTSVKVRSIEFAGAAESLAVIVKLKLPADMGVPEIRPVVLSARPGGRVEPVLVTNE